MYKDAESIYKQTLVDTAPPNRLLLYLYERAIAHLKQAISHLEESPQKAKEKISYAYKILDELIVTFDSSEGEIFENLSVTHKPVAQKLSDIFFSRKIVMEELQKIIAFLVEFKDAWKKAIKADRQISAFDNDTEPHALVPKLKKNKGLNVRKKIK